MKVQVKRAFKSYFLSPKKQKSRQALDEMFFNLQYKCGLLNIYLSRIFPEFFLKPVYPTMIAEKYQIYGVKITERYICESKN